MTAYYNEFDPAAAAWLRELIKAGHIAPGVVDERSIEDVLPSDLLGFTQCHFFAGIGVWSYALRRAGWTDDRPAWTGSCPCQPFSAAGKGGGFDDQRHLWPHFHWLISQCRPAIVFGEQVASKDGLAWLDLVQADLEGAGYTSGAVDTCAAGFGAPHIRQRLYWVAYTSGQRQRGRWASQTSDGRDSARVEPERLCDAGWLADTGGERRQQDAGGAPGHEEAHGWEPHLYHIFAGDVQVHRSHPTNGFWRDADWLLCRDGKWRPAQPGTFPLASGASARVVRLRGYGNGLCAQQAQGFIEAVMEIAA